jgi:hypothetical protein
MKLLMEKWKKYANKEIKEEEDYYDHEAQMKQMVARNKAEDYVKIILDPQNGYLADPRGLARVLNDIASVDRQKYREVLFMLFIKIGRSEEIAYNLITNKGVLDIITKK